ncbi:myocyte-specific enhancer factor 2A-like [Solanum pennellii]|uniref:Myocyte-specific enhancer factor 2A-like n=1 Tax=Solanum pennellii TaxID=28526 RepID=A0ABM1H595_SOLPN|nr:myocyte-specific enhancer factor 2A-like [Solanum pennellii]
MTKGTGKKKIDIKKLASNSSRKVTFSKRRTGLFKKAEELATKSGARIALLVLSPAGRLYTSGDVSLFENNGFSSKPQLSTEIASNSHVKPNTLRLKNLNVEGCSEIFLPDGVLYSASEIPIVEDNLQNNGFSSNSDLSTDFSSNFYEDWSTLWLKNFKGNSEIFSPPGGFYNSGEFPIVVDELKNNEFPSNSDLSIEISSNSYAKPSTLHLKNFNVEGCSEIFSTDGRFYSSNEFSIVNDTLKNNWFSSNSDPSTDLGSNLYEYWSMENFNVEECSSIEELMLLKEKLEEKRDEIILKMEAEFIDSLLV